MSREQISEQARARLSWQLSQPIDRAERGEALPLTAQALALPTETSSEVIKRFTQVVEAITIERLIVPVPIEDHQPKSGGNIPLATVQVEGGEALAVFSSFEELLQWDRQARPMPMSGQKVALTALATGVGRICLNPGSSLPTLMARPVMMALAHLDRWLPPWDDTELSEEILVVSQRPECRILTVRCQPPVKEQTLWSGLLEVHLTVGVEGTPHEVKTQLASVLAEVSRLDRLHTACEKAVLIPRFAGAV